MPHHLPAVGSVAFPAELHRPAVEHRRPARVVGFAVLPVRAAAAEPELVGQAFLAHGAESPLRLLVWVVPVSFCAPEPNAAAFWHRIDARLVE